MTPNAEPRPDEVAHELCDGGQPDPHRDALRGVASTTAEDQIWLAAQGRRDDGQLPTTHTCAVRAASSCCPFPQESPKPRKSFQGWVIELRPVARLGGVPPVDKHPLAARLARPRT